jgi:Nif-specific regulatory protein
VIAATNRDLEEELRVGRFRGDLYYRLNVIAIHLPPLRQRRDDIPLLAQHFLHAASVRRGELPRRLLPDALEVLQEYAWPGNVRELENAIERAVVVCDGQVVHAHHLPPTLQTAAASGNAMSLSLKDAIDAFEKDLIQDALKTSQGSRAKAARLLNTTGRIMNYKVRHLGIDWRRFRK